MTTLIRATPGLRAMHVGSPDLVLDVVAQTWVPKPGDSWPCVLTDGTGAWYAAEVAYDGPRLVAYAVNSYADEATARTDARSRWHETTEKGRRPTGRTED